MKETHYIESVDELKAISDSFRISILMNLGDNPQSGQDLAEKMNVSRSKVHYHLKELEKHGFIEIVKQEIVNGIVQKFYSPVAKAFIPNMNIFGNIFHNGFQEIFIEKERLSDFQKDLDKLIEDYSVQGEKVVDKVKIYISI